MTDLHPTLQAILDECARSGASDVHLGAEAVPWFRHDGELAPTSGEILTDSALEEIVETMISAEQQAAFAREKELDLACTHAGDRYRVNVFRERDRIGLAIRRLHNGIRSYEELGLPEVMREFASIRDGLVLLTGPTGSGKSTTLATMIDTINRDFRRHIITIEDPIEYVHERRRSFVRQREIGRDVSGFHAAIRAALREDPDVILVGEMRDTETMRAAIVAAETGHLVFSTLHTGDTTGAVERILGAFPGDEQASLRQQLSMVLRAVVAQRLLPRSEGGRIAACEVLVNTKAVANLIRNGRSQQIPSMIEAGAEHGMKCFDHALAELVERGAVSEDAARELVADAGRFEARMKPSSRGKSAGGWR